MKSKQLSLVVLCSAMAVAGSTVFAAFEPLFQVTGITGSCSLQRPSEKAFSPAKMQKAYPFGTKITTGPKSSLTIQFSKGNTCRILANSILSVDQNSADSKIKIIRLTDGEVALDLKEDYHKDGNDLNVETATAVFNAIGCKFRVASKSEQGLRVVIARVQEGKIAVHGDNFLVKELGKDDWLSLLSPADRAFLRIKTLKGEFPVTIKDKNMQDKEVQTETGTVLKIWQQVVPETQQRVVTVIITDPKGTLVNTYTVTYKGNQSSGYESPSASTGSKEKLADNTGKTQSKGEKPKESKQGKGKRGNPVVKHSEMGFIPVGPDTSPDIDPDPAKDPTPVGNR